MINIKENLQTINNKIINAEIKAGKKNGEVKLMAVSKFHSITEIQQAIEEGQLLFGENRVQEANEKFPVLLEKNRASNPELHIIGTLQTNKVKTAVQLASCIQSVDSLKLIKEIEKQAAKIEKNINILMEIHTAEDSKSGFKDFDEVKLALDYLAEGNCPHITPKGFMTMAPFTQEETLIHKSFSTLRQLKEKLQQEYTLFNLSELSMGMSGDFEIAIAEGSTMVRVGTAIFGERNYSK